MAGKVFVSPGFYSSEKDLTFVTRQVGVTTLGLVGETTQGPAFQPIFISNYDEFKSFFGGLNATRVKDTGAPKYELPYIAKSYLSRSNQLFVTRVLGFSGYRGGLSWGITLNAALDPNTLGVSQSGTTYNPLVTFEVDSDGNLIDLQSSDSLLQDLYDNDIINFNYLTSSNIGPLNNISLTLQKIGNSFEGIEVSGFELLSTGSTVGGYSGVTSGLTIQYSGTGYSDVENKLVALLKSRGRYNSDEQLVFDISGNTQIAFGTTPNTANSNPLGDFSITGTSNFTGAFNYQLSFDRNKKNFITRVLGKSPKDGNTSVFVEELYENMFRDYLLENKILGINITNLTQYNNTFDNYINEYQPAVTPWIISELRGSNLLKLFRFVTISDGNTANSLFKISIRNILPDTREFDVEIRAYNDTDARPVILERFSRCSMNPQSTGYIAKRIGTTDGDFVSRSNYILVELNEEVDTSDAFPAGFVGYPVRDYTSNGNTTVQAPIMEYKKTYTPFENKRKSYLGLTSEVGFDQDFFSYKGVPNSSVMMWTGLTKGYHLDIDANGATIDGSSIVIDQSGNTYTPTFEFETGNAEFRTEFGLEGTDYEKVFARKFTLVPYGGFDGWDPYRSRRTNLDSYTINGLKGSLGLTSGVFKQRALTNGDNGTTSDYYAYLEAIWTFRNPEQTNINVFATPGIDTFDNTNLVEETIEMIEQDRADSLYITTTPDTDASGEVLLPEDVVGSLDGEFDSNYTATYWPWVQVNDAENNAYIYLPPTRDVVRNIALTDNIAFPWFAVAGIQRGDVDAIKARRNLTLADRDVLYNGRVNPITSFATEGIKIWGNKTMQVKESALNRINVRRLLLQARKLISAVSIRLLFEQNDDIVRNQFLGLVNPILDNIRSERGLTDFRVVLDNDPESIDRNELCGRIFIKPTRSLEFICVEFNILPTGASFDDI
jgi:hypothetical protein